MRKQMRSLLCILLAGALMACGVSAAAEPPAERAVESGIPIGAVSAVPATPENLEEDTWAQALSVGMMCWNSYTDRICPWEPYFAWDATGWYAALLYRVEGIDLLTQSAFLISGQRWLFVDYYASNSLLLRRADKHGFLIIKRKPNTIQHTPDITNNIGIAYIRIIA